MIRSMTGYGKGEVVFGDKKITVEIRSLNSKQLDLTVKTPSVYRQCEYDVRNIIGKKLQRGKIDVYICYELSGSQNTVSINKDAFDSYFNQIKEISGGLGVDMNGNLGAGVIASLLRMPEVVQNDSLKLSDEETAALKNAVYMALDAIDNFRAQEGRILISDILGRIDKIEKLKKSIDPYEKGRVETIKTRIRESIESLKIPIDSNRLEQEMIFYMEKLDITEEKVRLQNHCNYFREVAGSEENPGRKLGFISQEIGREINTLGSKSNESNMQQLVVGMKDELEKIKEQLLNIL